MKTLYVIFAVVSLSQLVWTARDANQLSIAQKECQFPYVASLIVGERVQKFLCTATIIGERKLVTAAHCVANKVAQHLSARVGSCSRSTNGNVTSVLHYVIPDQFNCESKQPRDSDIAIVVLAKSLTFNAAVRPIDLATPELRNRHFDNDVHIVGWGYTANGKKPGILSKSAVTLLPRAECKRKNPNQVITENMICTLREEQPKQIECQGDVGGPLVIRKDNKDILVGVITSGVSFLQSKRCQNLPTVYADVAKFSSWLISKGTPQKKLLSRGIRLGSRKYCNVEM